MAVQWPFRVVATMIYDHEWRGTEVRRNFGVLTLSFQTVRRKTMALPLNFGVVPIKQRASGARMRWPPLDCVQACPNALKTRVWLSARSALNEVALTVSCAAKRTGTPPRHILGKNEMRKCASC